MPHPPRSSGSDHSRSHIGPYRRRKHWVWLSGVSQSGAQRSGWPLKAAVYFINPVLPSRQVICQTNEKDFSLQSQPPFVRVCMCTSCGTSCRRSRARMWSRVSMEGDKPPCRQKIWKKCETLCVKGTNAPAQTHQNNSDLPLLKNIKLVPVRPPARWAADSRTGLWSTSRHWHCRTSSGTRRRSRRPAWSAATRGSLAGWWFAPGNGPNWQRKKKRLVRKISL